MFSLIAFFKIHLDVLKLNHNLITSVLLSGKLNAKLFHQLRALEKTWLINGNYFNN